jgi:hypothetical protein
MDWPSKVQRGTQEMTLKVCEYIQFFCVLRFLLCTCAAVDNSYLYCVVFPLDDLALGNDLLYSRLCLLYVVIITTEMTQRKMVTVTANGILCMQLFSSKGLQSCLHQLPLLFFDLFNLRDSPVSLFNSPLFMQIVAN